MSVRMQKIEKTIRRVRHRLGRAKLAQLPQHLQAYAETGEQPKDELAANYVQLTMSALAAMDSSIGGEGHEVDCLRYQESLDAWNTTLRRAGL